MGSSNGQKWWQKWPARFDAGPKRAAKVHVTAKSGDKSGRRDLMEDQKLRQNVAAEVKSLDS